MKSRKLIEVRFLARCMGASAIAVGVLLLGAQPASAANCIQDVWQAHGNKQNLTCTAQDVTLSQVTNIDVTAGGQCTIENGVRVCKCTLGGNVTFTADFRMDLTADTRYDTGFYIATDGDISPTGALTGLCAATQITSQNSATFRNLDAAPDTCGDITGPLGTAFNPQIVHFTLTMPCSDPDGNEQLDLPFCTTWRQPGSNQVCTSVNDVFPGSPSKCNCGLLAIPIFFEAVAIDVQKTAMPDVVPETGGSVTYNVSVKNTAQVTNVTLTTLTDSLYGDITTTGHDGITATTCVPDADVATCEIGGTIAPQATCTCQFTVTVPPGDTGQQIVDTVTACVPNPFGGLPNPICDTAPATVTYTDVPQGPTLTKTATAIACRIDATYVVVVSNNPGQDPTPDALTLNSLQDDQFGSITAAHAAGGGFKEVVSTTCGNVGSCEIGGTIPPSGNCSCTFVGRITTCDVTHTNTVTASATDDDGFFYDPTTTPPFPGDSATVDVHVTIP
jgi:hypothetical protein